MKTAKGQKHQKLHGISCIPPAHYTIPGGGPKKKSANVTESNLHVTVITAQNVDK